MNSNNGINESDLVKIVIEDVLRILGERNKNVLREHLESEIRASRAFIFKIITSLEKDNLIRIDGKFIRLTKNGRNEAKVIVKKHQFLEDYLKETRSKRDAHRTAHLLEHFVSEEVVNNLKILSTLKKEGVPLTQLERHTQGIITDIFLSDYGVFERIISMGIFLGEKITITNETPNAVIVKIQNKKFALDKKIAREIRVTAYETS